jgi:transposase
MQRQKHFEKLTSVTRRTRPRPVFIISNSLLKQSDFADMRKKSMNTTDTPTLQEPVCLGLDVSRDTLDACLLQGKNKPLHQQFANDEAGFVLLLGWTHSQAPGATAHFCLEATGSYSTGVALHLAQHEQRVSVVNPARIRFFGLCQRQGNKTDKADAHLIALFCQREAPVLWRAAAPEVQVLLSLVRRLHALGELVTQEQNRLAAPAQPQPQVVVDSLRRVLEFLHEERKNVQRQIRAHIKAHEQLARDAKLLQSIPGIGEKTAWDVLAELPDITLFDSAQSVAAYAGLAPREHRSGTSVRKQTRLSKQGNSRLRRAFYFPAVTGLTWNPLIKSFYTRLREAGKGKMVALAACMRNACMRKMAMIVYGVLKHQKPFDPDHQGQPQLNPSS